MNRIKNARSLFFVFLLFCTTAFGSRVISLSPQSPENSEPSFQETAHQGANQIFPVDQNIEIKTRPGFLYVHMEGSSPQWKLGALGEVLKKHPPVSGDGNVRIFRPSLKSGYQIVEEMHDIGTLNLKFTGEHRRGFTYFIRQGNLTIVEGEIDSAEIGHIPPIHLPHGEYSFQALSQGFTTPQPIHFTISRDSDPVNLDVSLSLSDVTLRVTTDPPNIAQGEKATLRRISPSKKEVVWSRPVSLSGDVIALEEGQYTLEFPQVEGYDGPGKSNILGRFNFNAVNSPYEVVGNYTEQKSRIIVSYSTGPKRERIDRVRFWVIDEKGNRFMYPKEFDYTDNVGTYEREVTIESPPPGKYTIEFLVPNADNLFAPIPKHHVTVNKGKSTEVSQEILPRYGKIEADIDVQSERNFISIHEAIESKQVNKLPFIAVLDSKGNVQASSATGKLLADDLVPGKYTVVYEALENFVTPPETRIEVAPGEFVGPLTGRYATEAVELTIASNQEDRQWTLHHYDEVILSDKGSRGPFLLPTGDGYSLEVEEMENFDVDISTGEDFELIYGEPLTANITYTPEFGTLSFETHFETVADDQLTVHFTKNDGSKHESKSFFPENAYISWEDGKFPAGEYVVNYEVPPYYHPLDRGRFTVGEGDHMRLRPEFSLSRAVHVSTNYDEARFTLHSVRSDQEWKGSGNHFIFEGLFPGEYILSFDTTETPTVIAPENIPLSLARDHDAPVDAYYSRSALLTVSSNVREYSISITPHDERRTGGREWIFNKSKTFTLPEGKYTIDFHPLEGELTTRFSDNHPEPVEIILEPKETEHLHAIYEANRGSLLVTSNLNNASYTVSDISEGTPLVIGTFRGQKTVIPLTFVGKYRVVFDELPNYKTPSPIEVHVRPDKRETVGGKYLPLQQVSHVKAGPVMVGDTFGDGGMDEKPSRTVNLSNYSIGIYEVTNTQFANWLTKAVSEGEAIFVTEKGLRGQVKDLEGHLLFETVEADSDSQIRSEGSAQGTVFRPVMGKENHPVIEVSWYGAQAYCKANNCRLPTEAEWEKAASMAQTPSGKPLRKYYYGFGKDIINKTLANYTEDYGNVKTKVVRTSPVGFYDGVSIVAFREGADKEIYQDPSLMHSTFGSSLSKSPYGLFDMSGNVREWVHDWYDPTYYQYIENQDPKGPGHGSLKVTKGGSYNSVPYELRASARMPLPPETTDSFTGFRIVLDE